VYSKEALVSLLQRKQGAQEVSAGMPVLEGGPTAQVLMPLDYPPSRRLQPRWGHSHPSHSGLVALFDKRRNDYREVIRGVRALHSWLAAIPARFTSETAPEPGWVGGPMTALDLAILYYFVARSRARVYLEVGSGVSTCFARRAISDHRLPTRIVSIDPEPRAAIDRICDEVVRTGLEEADLGIFETLQARDIVFIDGSHRSFMNSDVTVLMLDVIPRLAPGVIVHLHDVTLPNDYPDLDAVALCADRRGAFADPHAADRGAAERSGELFRRRVAMVHPPVRA
jgi:hypothetical protein